MKHLIAIDEVEAVYWDDGRPDKPIDACDYIDKFISIRTPANLIEFLHTYPGGLVELRPWVDRVSPHKSTSGSKYSWFEPKRMISAMETVNRKMGLGIDWIDSMNDKLVSHSGIKKENERLMALFYDLVNVIDAVQSAPESNRKALLSKGDALIDAVSFDGIDEYAVSISSLRLVNDALRLLFKVAAVANGRGKPDFPIIRVDAGPAPWLEDIIDLDVGSIRNLNVIIPFSVAYLLVPFMNRQRAAESLKSFRVEHDSLRFYKCEVGDYIVFEDSYSSFNEYSTLPNHWTNEYIAKFLTSWALTEWLREYTSKQHVEFNPSGFHRSNTCTNEIVDAIFDYIANDRIGICDRCGMPFVADRKEPDGSFSRHYCTKTCRNTASKERANNG